MKASDFDYHLPEGLIAQHGAEPRDASRLMVCHRGDSRREHRIFRDLPQYLRPGDALVINQTRVIPARLIGTREGRTGAVEVLLLKRLTADTWEALVRPGRKLPPGERAVFGEGLLTAHLLSFTPSGGRILRFEYQGVFEQLLEQLGQMPLPPYITEKLSDPSRYQTVYAKQDGSAAAPTAGLHFTPGLMDQVAAMGVDIIPVLLHVGLGTFRPVKEEDVSRHQMHSEYYEVTQAPADRINAARARGGRVICVGTTTVRTLESACDEGGVVQAAAGDTAIFIAPGVKVKAVDGLITNFHLPKSTLLMLVSAFMGRENALEAYREAVDMAYRFFSFGDAMLILP